MSARRAWSFRAERLLEDFAGATFVRPDAASFGELVANLREAGVPLQTRDETDALARRVEARRRRVARGLVPFMRWTPEADAVLLSAAAESMDHKELFEKFVARVPRTLALTKRAVSNRLQRLREANRLPRRRPRAGRKRFSWRGIADTMLTSHVLADDANVSIDGAARFVKKAIAAGVFRGDENDPSPRAVVEQMRRMRAVVVDFHRRRIVDE